MKNLNEIRTSNWRLRLPADWTGARDLAGGFQFESADGLKELYIATHVVAPQLAGSLEATARWFAAAEMSTLAAMQGYSWNTVEHSLERAPHACVCVLDSVDLARQYRVVAKFLARPGQVVRASFHDYQCLCYEQSRACFASVLTSLEFIEPQRGGSNAIGQE